MGLLRERHASASRPVPRTTRSALLLMVVIALVLVWGALLAGWALFESRHAAEMQIEQSSANVAAVAEDDVERVIGLYDLSLQGVVDDLHLPGIANLSDAVRQQLLFDHAASARYLGAIRLLDANGRVTLASQDVPAPAQGFADTEFFRQQRDHPNLGLHVGLPFQDAATGGWSMPISRRIDGPDGSFAGVIFGTLDLDYFKALFARVDTGRSGAIALFRDDGRLLYRTPFDPALLGRPIGLRRLGTARSGTFTAPSEIDGVERFYAYRRVADLPLILRVGVASDVMYVEWTQKALAIGLGTLSLGLAVGLLAWALLRELRLRARAERTALESERRYRLLTEQSFDMIVCFDPRTQDRNYVSPACRRLYGYEPDEAMRMSATEIIHPDDQAGVRDALQRLEWSSGHTPILYRGRRKDGTFIWVEASLTRSTNPDTGAVEVVSVVRDASERIRYEAALREAKETADAASSSKSRFLATVSHEVRTPLNAIIGFTEIMQGEVLGPLGNDKYRSYIADIHAGSTHLLQLINEILDLAKAEAGKLELDEEVIDLGEVIGSVVRLSRAPIEKAGLTATIDLSPDLPRLRADERKTRQILFNLLGNAVKFTPPGGRVTLTARQDAAGDVAVTVADTGIGMAPDDLKRAVEPFVQIDNELSRNHQGTGLGLPTVKALIEAHGGRFELKSAVGVGTECTIVFPPGRVVQTSAAARAPQPAA